MPHVETFDPELERVHRRMDDIERKLQRFNNPAPTVPQYDLQGSVAPGIVFVVAGRDHLSVISRVMTSVDGSAWDIATDPTYNNNEAYCVANGGGLIIVGSDEDSLMSSDGGVTWVNITTSFDNGQMNAIEWCDTLNTFVAGGWAQFFDIPILITTDDGISWSNHGTPWDNGGGIGAINGLSWSHTLGKILALGANSSFTNTVMSSFFAVVWNNTAEESDGSQLYAAAFSSSLNLWAATGVDPYSIIISPDGDGMTTAYSFGGGQGADICWSEDKNLFVAAGSWGPNSFLISNDGVTWTPITSPLNETTGVCYSPALGKFAACNGADPYMLTSTDGITWVKSGNVAFHGRKIIAIR